MIDGFTLEIKALPDGRRVLHFPYMALSDIHWGTKYSRAKRLCQMLQETRSGRLDLVGDIVDGQAMTDREAWTFGPYQRQGMAEILRRAGEEDSQVNLFPGNHDEALRGRARQRDGRTILERSLFGRAIYGVRFADEGAYRAPDGRTYLVVHGDRYDDQILRSEEARRFWYRLGGSAYQGLYEIDTALGPLIGERSLANGGKRLVKTFINQCLGIRKVMAGMIDRSPYDGAIYGHSHMAGFQRTPGGKLLMNDGCSTEGVQALVHDKNGRWAIMDWHKDRIALHLEDGRTRHVTFRQLGLQAKDEPAMTEDAFTARADRLLRLAYRIWPPQDRQRAVQAYAEQQTQVRRFAETIRQGAETHGEGLTAIYQRALQTMERQRAMLQPPIQRARVLPDAVPA